MEMVLLKTFAFFNTFLTMLLFYQYITNSIEQHCSFKD